MSRLGCLGCTGVVRFAVVGLLGLAVSPSGWAQLSGGERIKQQDMFVGMNLLGPGAQDDWPLKARQGETLILSVTSRAFDSVVELIGPTGQVVAQNDDVRQGQQNALLLVRLTEGGSYQVRVTASGGRSGGEYQLTVRRFVAAEVPVGARWTGTLGKSGDSWVRFRAEADQTIVLTARSASFTPTLQVIAPNGEGVPAGSIGPAPQGTVRVVFRAPRAGDYSTRLSAIGRDDPGASFAMTIAIGRVFPTDLGQPNPAQHLEAGGLDLWTFRGEPGDLVRVRAKAVEGEMVAHGSYVPPTDSTGQPQEPEGLIPPLVVLPSDPKASGELAALCNIAGTYQVAVWHPLGVAVDYTLTSERVAQPLAEANESTGTLGLGGADYWTFEGNAGQIARLGGLSDRFDAELEIYDPQGTLISRNDDGGAGRDALATVLLTDRGSYILRIHAHGDGGAGPYQVRRVPDPARPLAWNASGEGTVGPGGAEVWSFDGHAGQTMIVSARSPDFNVSVVLFGPDAAELVSDDDGGEGTDSLLSARLPVDGSYTLWVSAADGGGRYTIQLIEAK